MRRLVIRVLYGRPVIHLAIALYVGFRVAVSVGVPVHQAGDAQNMVGRIAANDRWCATCAGTPRDRCLRKLKLLSTWFP